MKKPVIQAITLISSISLLILFLGYRSGWFNNQNGSIQSSPNGSSLNNANAAPNAGKDSLRKKPYIMPSSKAMVLPEDIEVADTPATDTADLKLREELMIMPSSKSGGVISPRELVPAVEEDSNATNQPPK